MTQNNPPPAQDLNSLISKLLQNYQVGNLQQQRKPTYSDTPPIWKDQFMLGQEGENDLRRYTQLKLWIKPPSQRFPKANAFLSLVNVKGSVFVRLQSIDELDALRVWLDNIIPVMRSTLEAQGPLEVQIEQANMAYDAIANASQSNNGDGED